MKTTIAGIFILILSGTNIFFTFIPEPPLTVVMMINAFFAVIGVFFMVLGALSNKAPESKSVVEERNQLLLDLDEKNTKLLALEKSGAAGSTSPGDTAVISFLSLLQQKGRFVDFIMDDVTRYEDAQVGAAARVVHQGCSEVIRNYFDLIPVQTESEGETVTVEPEEGVTRFRLLGKVTGKPPYRGTLIHRGWQTRRVELPQSAVPASRSTKDIVVSPAEIELT